VGRGDARFEPGTAGHNSGALPLSYHASQSRYLVSILRRWGNEGFGCSQLPEKVDKYIVCDDEYTKRIISSVKQPKLLVTFRLPFLRSFGSNF
jgi:hypothetical protein